MRFKLLLRLVGRAVAVAPFMKLFAVTASAQSVLIEYSANRGYLGDGDGFGNAVASLGDIDGDGVVDALVAAMGYDVGPSGFLGAIYVVSGATGSIIRTHVGPEAGGRLGIQVSAGADLDGDGVSEYAAATLDVPRPTSEGTVYLYSGASGALLFTFVGERKNDSLACPQMLGDVDLDGVEDFGLGAGGYDLNTIDVQVGRTYVYSGTSFVLLDEFTGTKANQGLSWICGIGDVDGDGSADLCLGNTGWNAGPNREGKIEVYSGSTGSFLYRRIGENPDDFFGASVIGIGDMNGDSAPDFAVRAFGHDIVDNEGRVYVYSGSTGTLLYTFDGMYKDQGLGILPARGSVDLNADGYADLLIGSSYVPSGGGSGTGPADSSVFAYSGRTGRLLYEFRGRSFGTGQISESLGSSLSEFGDFNGDGFGDFIAGAQGYCGTNTASEGRAYVYGGNDLFLQANLESYAAGDSITLANRGGPPGSLSMIVLTDVNGASAFVPILIGALDGNGELTMSGTTPAGLSGLSCTFMGYAVKASGHGLADSIPETITFQ